MSLGCEAGDEAAVGGTVEAPAEVLQALSPTSTLFLAAKAEGVASAPPLAALKVVGARLPYAFRLGADDVLMPGRHFGGKMRITAHLRRSGLLDIPTPGDASGQSEVVVEPGATGVIIRLVPLKVRG